MAARARTRLLLLLIPLALASWFALSRGSGFDDARSHALEDVESQEEHHSAPLLGGHGASADAGDARRGDADANVEGDPEPLDEDFDEPLVTPAFTTISVRVESDSGLPLRDVRVCGAAMGAREAASVHVSDTDPATLELTVPDAFRLDVEDVVKSGVREGDTITVRVPDAEVWRARFVNSLGQPVTGLQVQLVDPEMELLPRPTYDPWQEVLERVVLEDGTVEMRTRRVMVRPNPGRRSMRVVRQQGWTSAEGYVGFAGLIDGRAYVLQWAGPRMTWNRDEQPVRRGDLERVVTYDQQGLRIRVVDADTNEPLEDAHIASGSLAAPKDRPTLREGIPAHDAWVLLGKPGEVRTARITRPGYLPVDYRQAVPSEPAIVEQVVRMQPDPNPPRIQLVVTGPDGRAVPIKPGYASATVESEAGRSQRVTWRAPSDAERERGLLESDALLRGRVRVLVQLPRGDSSSTGRAPTGRFERIVEVGPGLNVVRAELPAAAGLLVSVQLSASERADEQITGYDLRLLEAKRAAAVDGLLWVPLGEIVPVKGPAGVEFAGSRRFESYPVDPGAYRLLLMVETKEGEPYAMIRTVRLQASELTPVELRPARDKASTLPKGLDLDPMSACGASCGSACGGGGLSCG